MNQEQTTIFNHARHTAAQKFIFGRIVLPAMKLFFSGVFLLVLFFSIEETLGANSSFLFTATAFFLVALALFCIPAYFFAMNNNGLLKETLKEYLESLEDLLQMYNEYVTDTKEKVRELQANRMNFLSTIWMRCSLEDLAKLLFAVNERVAQIENIIESADSKEKIKHQEYYLSLNYVLTELIKLKGIIEKTVPGEFNETLYAQLREKTQKSFDNQIHSHNLYIGGLRKSIGILHTEMETTQQLLT